MLHLPYKVALIPSEHMNCDVLINTIQVLYSVTTSNISSFFGLMMA